MKIFEYISNQDALNRLIYEINEDKIIAIDTEFSRNRTYFPELCLIQLATKNKLVCIDCLCVEDINVFIDSLFRKNKVLIMHSARQDLDALYLYSKKRSFTLIDTQIGASLVGEKAQIGLKPLLDLTLKKNIDKSFTRIDWKKRPLSDDEINYAIEDVKYLIPIWNILKSKLIKLDRMSWIEEECERLKAIEPLKNELGLFLKLKGISSLNEEKKDIAYNLIKWRENKARLLNLPRQWIIGDKQISLIAKKGLNKKNDFISIENIPENILEKYGEEIKAELKNKDNRNSNNYSELFSTSEKKDFELLNKIAKERSKELNIENHIFITEKEISDLSRGLYSERIKNGWRSREIKKILQLISKLTNSSE